MLLEGPLALCSALMSERKPCKNETIFDFLFLISSKKLDYNSIIAALYGNFNLIVLQLSIISAHFFDSLQLILCPVSSWTPATEQIFYSNGCEQWV